MVELGDHADERAARDRGRKHAEHRFDGSRRGRRRRTPGRREKRDAVRSWRTVEQAERMLVAPALPGAEKADPPDIELSVGTDADAGARGRRLGPEHPVLHPDPARMRGVPVEEVTVA